MALTATDAIDRFLQRTMPVEQYLSIKMFEPCVVEASTSRTVRFVIVTDSQILATENPPKHIQTLVDFDSVLHIDLVSSQMI